MNSQPPIDTKSTANPATDAMRASARRTALFGAAIALLVYVGFIALNAVTQ